MGGESPCSTRLPAGGRSTRGSSARAKTSGSTTASPSGLRGEVLISHIRQKTIGDTALVNTHPFERGRWIFAHNGTVKDVAWLRANASHARLAEIQGETDSELLFAWLLTHLDEAGARPTRRPAPRPIAAIGAIARAGRERPDFGAFNFLLSDGSTTYAHRFGRSMFLLERSPEDAVVSSRTTRDGTILETPWSPGRAAVFVASERITDEPHRQTIDDGTLLRIEAEPLATLAPRRELEPPRSRRGRHHGFLHLRNGSRFQRLSLRPPRLARPRPRLRRGRARPRRRTPARREVGCRSR